LSEIRATTISDAAGTGPIDLHKQSAAKAWVNFNSLTTTSVLASFNVSGIVDAGTGTTTVSLSSSMSTTNEYSVLVTSEPTANLADNVCYDVRGSRTSGSVYIITAEANVAADSQSTNATIHGDLA
jgi:hypothetical protein